MRHGRRPTRCLTSSHSRAGVRYCYSITAHHHVASVKIRSYPWYCEQSMLEVVVPPSVRITQRKPSLTNVAPRWTTVMLMLIPGGPRWSDSPVRLLLLCCSVLHKPLVADTCQQVCSMGVESSMSIGVSRHDKRCSYDLAGIHDGSHANERPPGVMQQGEDATRR